MRIFPIPSFRSSPLPRSCGLVLLLVVVVVLALWHAAGLPRLLRRPRRDRVLGRRLRSLWFYGGLAVLLTNEIGHRRALTVIAAGGDGDGYAIGAGHFVHTVRRNPDITYIVMDNQTYGLTKGQSSPTSAGGYVTSTSPAGNPDNPLNGLALALAAGATFLARGFAAQPKALVALMAAAIAHRGFSIVEVMSPCVTFNKHNTYAWFRANVCDIAERDDYAPTDRGAAFDALTRDGAIPLGIIYRENRPTFEDRCGLPDSPITQLDLHSSAQQYAAIARAYR